MGLRGVESGDLVRAPMRTTRSKVSSLCRNYIAPKPATIVSIWSAAIAGRPDFTIEGRVRTEATGSLGWIMREMVGRKVHGVQVFIGGPERP